MEPSATSRSINSACSSQKGCSRVPFDKSRFGQADEITMNVFFITGKDSRCQKSHVRHGEPVLWRIRGQMQTSNAQRSTSNVKSARRKRCAKAISLKLNTYSPVDESAGAENLKLRRSRRQGSVKAWLTSLGAMTIWVKGAFAYL